MLPEILWGHEHRWDIGGGYAMFTLDSAIKYAERGELFIVVRNQEEYDLFSGYKLICGVEYVVFLGTELPARLLEKRSEYVVIYTFDPRHTSYVCS